MRTVSFFALFLFSTTVVAQEQNVLQLAKLAHTQARQSIHSIRATMNVRTEVFKENPANVITRTCQWLESGTSFRWELTTTDPHDAAYPKKREKQPRYVKVEQTSIGVQKDGKRTTTWKRRENDDDKTIRRQGVILASTEPLLDIDLWSGAGFLVLDNPRVSLVDILKKDDGHTLVAWASEGNRKIITVHHTMSDFDIKADLAPEYGYLAQRILTTALQDGKPTICCLLEVEGFKNYGPGLFFPNKTIKTIYPRDSGISNASVRSTFLFEDVRINEAIESSAFELKIPAGVRVVDKTKDVGYVMGDDGNPDPKHPVLRAVHYNPQQNSTNVSTPTTTRLWHRNKLLFGFLLGLIALILLVVRIKLKKRRTT